MRRNPQTQPGADAAERENPGLTPFQPNADRDQRSSDADAHTSRKKVITASSAGRFVEILSGLGTQGDRGASIDPHCRPRSHAGACLAGSVQARHMPTSLRIHLDLLQRLSEAHWGGAALWNGQQATGCVQDLPDSSTGMGQRDLCCLQRLGHGEDNRAEHEGQAPASSSLAEKSASPRSVSMRGYPSGSREHDAPANENTTERDHGDHLLVSRLRHFLTQLTERPIAWANSCGEA